MFVRLYFLYPFDLLKWLALKFIIFLKTYVVGLAGNFNTHILHYFSIMDTNNEILLHIKLVRVTFVDYSFLFFIVNFLFYNLLFKYSKCCLTAYSYIPINVSLCMYILH